MRIFSNGELIQHSVQLSTGAKRWFYTLSPMQNFWLCLSVTKSCNFRKSSPNHEIFFRIYETYTQIRFVGGGNRPKIKKRNLFSRTYFCQNFKANVHSSGLQRQHLMGRRLPSLQHFHLRTLLPRYDKPNNSLINKPNNSLITARPLGRTLQRCRNACTTQAPSSGYDTKFKSWRRVTNRNGPLR